MSWKRCIAGIVGAALTFSVFAQTRVEYVHTDALGSPVAVTDVSGNVVEREVYEPYGSPITRPPSDQPGFTGHVADSQTNLAYMQQRYYDPQIGRFLSVDPVTAYSNPASAFNRYWYASNNPYRYTDPDGRQAGPAMGPVSALMMLRRSHLAEKTGDGARYGSNREAHRAAQMKANPISISKNREYGGKTYKTNDERYGFTSPKAGSDTGFNPALVSVPAGTSTTGDYHTHGDYSLADTSGAAIRTSDPKRDSFNSDQFSNQDIRGITADAAGKSEYSGSLGTPSGKFYEYNPKTERPEPKRID